MMRNYKIRFFVFKISIYKINLSSFKMESHSDGNQIMNRIKSVLHLNNDKELASYFEVAPNTVAGWRQRNTLDYERLFSLCYKHKVNLNYIVYGIGSEKNVELMASEISSTTQRDLIFRIFETIQRNNDALSAVLKSNMFSDDERLKLFLPDEEKLPD